ncbi:MAG: hypothetical protein IJX16_04865 [Clostridia bacterium]|nr:hypothetical protein [Clostridia bacterium]
MPKKKQSLKQKAYNAQRTYESAAKKFAKEAKSAKGAEKRNLNKAASRMRNQAQQIAKARTKQNVENVVAVINNAPKFREMRGVNARGNVLGEALLAGSNNAGHRFFSLTKDIWQNAEYENRYDALRDYFGDISITEMIEQLSEESGIDILKGNINLDTDSLGGLSKEEYLEGIAAMLENRE